MRTGAPGLRVLEAVLPNWDVWLDGAESPLTYRVTQVLTGQGCFGEYLHRIKKEATTRCHHFDASMDSAQHTLEFCGRVGAAAPRPHRGNRMGPLAAGDPRGPSPAFVSRLCFEKRLRSGWGCGPTPIRSAGENASEAVDAFRRGALGSPRPPVGSKLRRWQLRSGKETRLPCTTAPATRHGITWLHTAPLVNARGDGRASVQLAPVPGAFSIAAGTVIVQVLVGWFPALPLRYPPEATWCPCGFLPCQKKISAKIDKILLNYKCDSIWLLHYDGVIYFLTNCVDTHPCSSFFSSCLASMVTFWFITFTVISSDVNCDKSNDTWNLPLSAFD